MPSVPSCVHVVNLHLYGVDGSHIPLRNIRFTLEELWRCMRRWNAVRAKIFYGDHCFEVCWTAPRAPLSMVVHMKFSALPKPPPHDEGAYSPNYRSPSYEDEAPNSLRYFEQY